MKTVPSRLLYTFMEVRRKEMPSPYVDNSVLSDTRPQMPIESIFMPYHARRGYAHADRDPVPQGDNMRGLPAGASLTQDGVD
jgi:hypothetical protein